MTLVPIAIFWLLAIWGVFSSRPVLFYLFFATMAFGSTAVIPTQLTAGLTFTGTPIVMLLLTARAYLSRDGLQFFLTSALRVNRMGLLFLFWLVAILTTIFMPKIFANDVLVIEIRDVVAGAVPLRATPQNITQLVYLSISIMAAFTFAKILRSRVDRQYALQAMVFGGAVVVGTGLVDWAAHLAGAQWVLEPFRTASYALITELEVMGSKRVVGLMPEASSYGGLCLGFLSMLIFFRRAIVDPNTRNIYAPVVIAGLLGCLYLSTSSGAYLGLGVLVIVTTAEALLRAFSTGKSGKLYRQDLLGEATVVLAIVVVLGITFLLRPAVLEPVFALVDRMVLQKADSGSFEERGMWRTVALDALWATNGLGVGLGSTRASSSLVAIFSNTGILGGLLYYGFVLQTMLRKASHLNWEGQVIVSAFRFSFIPPFVVGMMVGGTDFGGLGAFGFGIVVAVLFSRSGMAARAAAGSRQHGSELHRGQRGPVSGPEPQPGLS